MTDVSNGNPAAEEDTGKGIELGADGDPIRQGSLMNERQSYERVIEGLKIAADAGMHLVKSEPHNGETWRKLSDNLDQVRRICVQKAGLGLVMKEQQTREVNGEPMAWREAKERFREGLMQAEGGCRQLATCHRGDVWWSICATQLEKMQRAGLTQRASAAPRLSPLILPPGYTRH